MCLFISSQRFFSRRAVVNAAQNFEGLEPDIELIDKKVMAMVLGRQVGAGVPILQALSNTAAAVESVRMKRVLESISDGIRSGKTLDSSINIEEYPELDDGLLRPMIGVGEETGELDTFLLELGKRYRAAITSRPGYEYGIGQALGEFTRILAQYFESGLPILRNLKLVRSAIGKMGYGQMEKATGILFSEIESGAILSEAMEKLPQFFPKHYSALVKAGESMGQLDKVLKDMIDS